VSPPEEASTHGPAVAGLSGAEGLPAGPVAVPEEAASRGSAVTGLRGGEGLPVGPVAVGAADSGGAGPAHAGDADHGGLGGGVHTTSASGDASGVPDGSGAGAVAPVAGSGRWDVVLRVCGGLVAVAAAVVTAVAEIFFAPLRVLVGVSVLIAVVANAALVRFTAAVAGGRWVVVPAIIWIALMIMASARSTEGDILLADNWVGLGTIFAGSIAFAGAAYRLILPKDRP
jgi:hypothetical protein